MKSHYLIKHLLLSNLIFYFFIFISCNNDPKLVETFLIADNSPSETMYETELLYTEKGKLKVKILAQKIEKHTYSSNIINFSDGITVFFYDDSTNLTSKLTATEAIIDNKKKQMQASINVELLNTKNEKLNTEQLIWNEEEDLIFSEKSVWITTKDEIIFGEGFESSSDFSSYRIKKVKGSINIKSN